MHSIQNVNILQNCGVFGAEFIVRPSITVSLTSFDSSNGWKKKKDSEFHLEDVLRLRDSSNN